MSTVLTDCWIESLGEPERSSAIRQLPVDEGSSSTWILRATLARIGAIHEEKQLRFSKAAGGVRVARRVME